MPQQFHQSEEPTPLQMGVPERFGLPAVAAQTDAARYTPDDVQRILAEAARLQTYHQETLSQNDIEAIGHDVGIEPKFVHQALAQAEVTRETTPHSRKRIPRLRLQPLPFHAVAKTALLPILYACVLVPVTSWQPGSGFARFFIFLYMVLPALLAFATGFLQRKIRLSAVTGAFWGLSILFAFALPNSIKLYQNLDNPGSVEMLQLLSETGMIFGIFLAWGVFLGLAGALARRGVEKGRKWYGKRCSSKTRANSAALRGV